jgi:hypothetical protein
VIGASSKGISRLGISGSALPAIPCKSPYISFFAQTWPLSRRRRGTRGKTQARVSRQDEIAMLRLIIYRLFPECCSAMIIKEPLFR